MTGWIAVASSSAVPVGTVRAVVVAGRKLALIRTERGFYALDNTCPHRGGPLAEGDVIGSEIVCPWHLWSFDVESGRTVVNPEMSVRTHDVRLEGDSVLVRLNEEEESD